MIQYSDSMTKKELEAVYFKATNYHYKGKTKQDVINVIKQRNRAIGNGQAFRKLAGK
jgi:hypothetical protein